jgi:hypothetical protein
MSFKVYKSKKEDTDVFFKLASDSDGSFTLIVVNADGVMIDHGKVLTIEPDGKLHLHPLLNKRSGLTLNPENGTVAVHHYF